MTEKIEIGVLEISIKSGEIEIFDGNQWVGIGIELGEWQSVKEAVDKLIADNKKTQEKRQPIKEQTLDEFNNTRSVSYGSNVQVEPLTDSIVTADRFVLIHPDTGEKTEVKPHFIIRNGVGIAQLDSYVDDKYLYKK